jgi:hypothetical protein
VTGLVPGSPDKLACGMSLADQALNVSRDVLSAVMVAVMVRGIGG